MLPLIMAGTSIAGAGLSNRSKTVTNTPTYSAGQTDLQGDVLGTLSKRLASPVNLSPLKTAATGKINRTYNGLEDRLQSRFSGAGMGRSGKVLTNAKQLEVARAGDIGDMEAKFSGLQLDEESRRLDQALRAAWANPGSSQVLPGNAAGASLSAGSEAITTLMMLAAMTGGG